MSRWFWPILWAVTLVACGLLSSQPRSGGPSGPVAPAVAPECPREEDVAALTSELERCQAATKPEASPRTRALRRIRLVQTPGPPRKCGGSGPTIAHVPTRECAKGMVCLDAKAQRLLTLNLAAYEAWVRKVQSCESAE